MSTHARHPEILNQTSHRPMHAVVSALFIAILWLATSCADAPASLPRESSNADPAITGHKSTSINTSPIRPAQHSTGTIKFRRLTLEDGLSQSSINCAAQDARGFMWFGTQDGLNRFDGYEFRVYRHDPEDATSLRNNYIIGCECDQRDVLWILTRDGILHRYEPDSDAFIRYDLALKDPFRLAGSEITTLLGDAQGQLWISTRGDGLLRYNPEEDRFTTYQHEEEDPTSLSHRIVYRVYEDHQGAIWVGTEGGLNRYEPESDGFIRYPYRDFPKGAYQPDPPVHAYDPAFQPENPHALASPAVIAIHEDRQGRLWIGTRYGGLNRLDRDSDQFTAYPYDPAHEPDDPNTFSGNSVRGLMEDRDGHIWVASSHWNLDETRTYARLGLERLDPESGTVTRFPADPDDPCALPHEAVLRMIEDRSGNLWFHTFGGGIELYDRNHECFVHYDHDPDDEESLSSEDVSLFYEDSATGLWIGSTMGGISYYDRSWDKFPTYRARSGGGERLSNRSVWRIAPSPDHTGAGGHAYGLWVSTFAGLNYWDRQTDTFHFYEIDPRIPDVIAYAIHEDTERQTLWLGTSMGLERTRLSPERGSPPSSLTFTRVLTRVTSSRGTVTDLHPAGDDAIWLALYQVGLSRFDLTSEEIVATFQTNLQDERSLADDRLTDIAPGRDGTLWLTTQSGIEHFNPATGTFLSYPHEPDNRQSVAERVLALYEDETGTVWLGTDGAGLQRFDPESGVVTGTYRVEDGLPNNVVYSILPDETGRLWLSTNRGLTRFDVRAGTFESYTSQDGLQSNEFNLGAAFRAEDGELFFGGVDGINAFYSTDVAPNPYIPPVMITDIALGPPRPSYGTDISTASSAASERQTTLAASAYATEAIELSHRDRILTFEFAALHYALPERNQYAYRMEGFDPDWNYVGNRRYATYTNLPPGRYTFRVKGTNSDGLWNETGVSLAVTVKPPFWATWWFRAITGLILVGTAGAGYRLRIRSIETRSRELEREVAERTKELAAVNAIAAVVSHSLDLNVLLTDALDKTLEVMNIESGGIYLLDEEKGLLTLATQRGFSDALATEIDRLRRGEGFSGRVAQTGEALVVRDISEDPRLTRSAVQREGLRSLATVPLLAKGRVLGTLFAVTKGYREFSDRDVDLLTAIGHQIGVAVDNARLYEDTRSRLAQLTALQETTMAVAGTLELDRLLRLIVEQATVLLHADGGILNLVNWETQEDEVVAAAGSATQALGRRSPLSGSLSGWATLNREAATLNNPQADERVDKAGLAYLQNEKGRPIENAAVAPLTIRDQVLGSLVILDKGNGQQNFEPNDLDLLRTFANQAATAIENARLFETEMRRAEEFRVISEVGNRTTSILSLDELLSQIVSLIQESFSYDIVEIGLVEGETLIFKAGAHRNLKEPFQAFRVRIGKEGITGEVAATGTPLVVPDVSQDGRYLQFTDSESRSELAVPIKAKEAIIGVLNIQSAQLDAFDESDLAVMQALADQAATAIDNARLFEAEQRRAEQFRVISEVGRRITSIMSIDSVLQQVAELIQSSFDYDHVGIATIEDDVAFYRVGAGELWESGEFEFFPARLKVGQEGVTGWVAGMGEPLLVPDVREDPRYVWMQGSRTLSELTVPITLKGSVIGVLDAQSNQLNAFDESDLSVLQSLADQTAIAIENARLYEQARRLAVVEERQRLARELHDSVTQALYGVTLYAEATARQLASGQTTLAAEHLRELRDTAQEALREMRLLIFELRPSVLESDGLVTALRARLEAVEERAGLGTDLRIEGEATIPAEIEEGLYRIAQEALNNALKHACAQNVSIHLNRGDEGVTLEIVDDGIGFDPEAAIESGGLGVDGMIERAAKMRGRLVLNSEPGMGTTVRVEVPQGTEGA